MAFWTITNSTITPGSTQATQQSLSATYKSLTLAFGSSQSLATVGVGPKRQRWNDILVGTNAAPGDTFLEFDVARVSALSSQLPTTLVISSLSSCYMDDTADTGFSAFAELNLTAETGITALSESWYVGINQRASYRWIANPGQEIVMPANTQTQTTFPGNGLDLRGRGSYTGTVTTTTKGSEL